MNVNSCGKKLTVGIMQSAIISRDSQVIIL